MERDPFKRAIIAHHHNEEADPNAPKRHKEWKPKEILNLINRSDTGTQITTNMPTDVVVKPMFGKPPPHVKYSPSKNVIYVAKGISSEQAAPLVAKFLVLSDQIHNRGRPYDAADRIQMEVDAKNAQLDVWAGAGRTPNPKLEKQYEERLKDPAAFEESYREDLVLALEDPEGRAVYAWARGARQLAARFRPVRGETLDLRGIPVGPVVVILRGDRAEVARTEVTIPAGERVTSRVP